MFSLGSLTRIFQLTLHLMCQGHVSPRQQFAFVLEILKKVSPVSTAELPKVANVSSRLTPWSILETPVSPFEFTTFKGFDKSNLD